MKKEYEKPIIEVMKLDIENIITDSGTLKKFDLEFNPDNSADETWIWK